MSGGFDTRLPRRLIVDEIITTGNGQLTGVTGWTGQGAAARYNSWSAPLPPSTSARVAAATVSSSNAAVAATVLANPDYPRAVRISPTTSQLATGNVTITGTNQFGASATDAIALGGTGAPVNGTVAFKTVTAVSLPAASSGTGTQACVSVTVGLSNVFGLDRQVGSVAAAIRGAVNGTAETTAPIVSASKHTASFSTSATSSTGALVEVLFVPQDTTHL